MFRSSIRSENSRGEDRHDRDHADRQGDGRREESLEARVERARAGDEHDRRRERDHEHVERELGDVPPEVAQRVAEVVAPLADGRVRAEEPSPADASWTTSAATPRRRATIPYSQR